MRLQLCVECGRDVPETIGGACPDCFVAKQPLLMVPEVLDVETCAHCDARHVGNSWIDPDEGVPLEEIREEALRAAVRVHERVRDAHVELACSPQDERHFRFDVTLTGNVEGAAVHDARKVLVRMRRSVCDRCSRMFGGYYAAVLQFRATQRDVTRHELERAHKVVGDELDRMRASGHRDAFLTKSGPVPGGFDYYLGDIEAARIISRQVASRLGATVVETAKLAGRKEGEDIYRVTFLVRIQLYAPGDFARIGDDRIVQVHSVDRGRAVVWDLATHKRDKVSEESLRRLGGQEILLEAVLVSQDPAHLQVLDPVSLQTVDLVRPEGFEVHGATILVLRHEERLYLPPSSGNGPSDPKTPASTA
ncbi:MAG: ribosomal export protein [Thermoplasmata archaeon]|jgi:nonsense-mediated mRNA decay protein 3|nr:ribosomal export protein [Thermoplasmata archaeon]